MTQFLALPVLPTADEILTLAKEAGLSNTALCAESRVHVSTLFRWRKGEFAIAMDACQRMLDTIAAARARKLAA